MPEGADQQSMIGQQLLHYKIVERLGAGGMGVVYRAIDQKLDRNVALKFLPPYMGFDSVLKQRMVQEAKAASALDHHNVGAIYGIEELPSGDLFIVMACYDGDTLAQKIHRGPMPVVMALQYTMQVAQGLAEAHSKGIVHRDIKPSNILITRQGVAKILDFGLAKTGGAVALTQVGTTVGTAAYMSPEQAIGQEADRRSDLWSLGVMLYEMLTGALPFPGGNPQSMLYKIIHEAPAAPPEPLSPEVDVVLQRALAKNPQERYQTAEQMLHELQAVLSGVPIDSETRTLLLPSSAGPQYHSARQTMAASAPGSKWWLGIAAVPLLAIAALAIPSVRHKTGAWLVSAPQLRRVAVLPFRNIGSDPANAALCDGLQEILTSRLASLKAGRDPLLVIPAGEVRRLKVTNASDANRDLNATLVLDGTLMKSGQTLQMTINLVDAKSLVTLDSKILSDPAGDFGSLQESAIRNIAELLAMRPTPEGATGRNTVPAASESYLRGIGYLGRFDKPENLDKAIAEFNDAIEKDPRYDLAYAGLGEASRLKYRINKDPKWLQSAIDNTKRALEQNDELAAAHVTMGRLHDLAGHTDMAVQEFDRAIKLDPGSADAILGLGSAHEHAGRLPDAEVQFRKAIDLRPEYWDGYNRLAALLAKMNRNSEAEQEYRIAVKYAPDNPLVLGNFGALLQNIGKRDEARKMYELSIKAAPTYSTYSNLGVLEFDDGHYDRAAQLFEQALKMNDRSYTVWANLAAAYNFSSGWDAKARTTYERAAQLAEAQLKEHPKDFKILVDLATYYAKLGRKEISLRRLRQAKALAPQDVDVSFWAAEAYEEMGSRDDALAELKTALGRGLDLQRITVDPEFRDLRKDARFAAMIQSASAAVSKK